MPTAEYIRRLIHTNEIPTDWASTNPKPEIFLGNARSTEFLKDDVSPGITIEIGGIHLEACVAEHLIALAQRKPVQDGRVTVILSQQATKSWHGKSGKIESCEPWEFKKVVERVKRETGVTIKIGD